jgi:hypothetical protein
MPFEATID